MVLSRENETVNRALNTILYGFMFLFLKKKKNYFIKNVIWKESAISFAQALWRCSRTQQTYVNIS